MAVKRNRQNTLVWLCLKQLFLSALFVFAEIIVFVVLFYIGLNNHIILPANYSEQILIKNKDTISRSNPFNEMLIPHTCFYGIFDLDKNYKKGNLNEKLQKDATTFLKNRELAQNRYFLIERENEYCVVCYDISAHFASPILHNFCPKLEFTIIILFIIVFVAIILLNAAYFSKKLKKELIPLLEAVEQIRNKELEFKIKHSGIKELDAVLVSLDDMKTALSESLKKEWQTEQKRKSHISALAHDIKTPLTIIKGNAELIKEEDILAKVYQYSNHINNSADKIERYIQLLIDATKNNFTMNMQIETINLAVFIEEIISEAKNLCKTKKIELISKTMNVEKTITADKELLLRAILNIIKDAVEHSSFDSKIYVDFSYADKKFIVETEDFGTGFTPEALKNAKNQFYTEKKERAKEHYGLGMYVADTVAKNYNGSIEYYNKPNQTGAVVLFLVRAE